MKYVVAQIAIFFIQLFRLLPFPILHLKSSATAFILGEVIGYRRKVVEQNLERCFPEKTIKERKKISRKFYLNISDILLESLKGLTLSKETIEARFKIVNPEILDKYFEKGESIICLASHYANWEWGIQAVNSQIQHQAISIYKPLSNITLERFMLKQRSRLGMKLYGMEDTREAFAQAQKEPVAIILAADQSPSDKHKSIIANFFNDQIGFIHGPEAYASKTKTPVVFFDVQRIKRGYYTLEIKELFSGKEQLQRGELTQKYASMVEEVIRKKPEDWLWSHKRWKHEYSFHPDYKQQS